ncbi:MAG: hypothetical protein HYR55_09635 [Acidobacteria bacterium]|nr:hypothetical protein [Acidobacteriota bacterium]MBI3656744.1 hypothetical protein [Acidobacteriota bacterium]
MKRVNGGLADAGPPTAGTTPDFVGREIEDITVSANSARNTMLYSIARPITNYRVSHRFLQCQI